MTSGKSYGQFCALARALDHIGDRWTLLIIRDLIDGARSFRSLQDSLAGVSPNLLLDRLRRLTEDGLVERSHAPRRSKNVTYALTLEGRSIEPVVLELIRWGARYMRSGPREDRIDPAWTVLALRALLDGSSPSEYRAATVHLDVGGYPITITTDGQHRRVAAGHTGIATARVLASMPDILAIATGERTMAALDEFIDGDATAAHAAFAPRRPTPAA